MKIAVTGLMRHFFQSVGHCSTVPHQDTPVKLYMDRFPMMCRIARNFFSGSNIFPLHRNLERKFEFSSVGSCCVYKGKKIFFLSFLGGAMSDTTWRFDFHVVDHSPSIGLNYRAFPKNPTNWVGKRGIILYIGIYRPKIYNIYFFLES